MVPRLRGPRQEYLQRHRFSQRRVNIFLSRNNHQQLLCHFLHVPLPASSLLARSRLRSLLYLRDTAGRQAAGGRRPEGHDCRPQGRHQGVQGEVEPQAERDEQSGKRVPNSAITGEYPKKQA